MPSSPEEHKARVRQEFTHQADSYASNPVVTDQGRLNRLLQAVNAPSGTRILDVATGSGAVALAFAESGCEVIGVDLTEAQLARAEQQRQARNLANLRYLVGDAEQLPFTAQAFDVVVSRYALHHCEDVPRVVAEMTRVCRTHGLIVVEDLIVSELPDRAEFQNRLERLRDPSHTRALPIRLLLPLFTSWQLEIETLYTDHILQEVDRWLANAQTPSDRARQIRALVEQDADRDLSGMHPFREDGTWYFRQRIAALIARKVG